MCTKKATEFDLAVRWETASKTLSPNLEISNSKSYVDSKGYMHLTGQVKNLGDVRATSLKVVAMFYDVVKIVIGVGYSNLEDLPSKQTATFEILLSEKDIVPDVSSYYVTAESNEYVKSGTVIIPEFPVEATSLITTVALATALLLSRKWLTKNTRKQG